MCFPWILYNCQNLWWSSNASKHVFKSWKSCSNLYNRYKLGRTCLKKVPISCIGILNYQGSDENFKSLLSQTEILREQYKTKLQEEIERILNPPSLHRLKLLQIPFFLTVVGIVKLWYCLESNQPLLLYVQGVPEKNVP